MYLEPCECLISDFQHMKVRRNETEVKKDQKKSYGKIRPKTDSSTDIDPSGGPIGQVEIRRIFLF